MAIAKPSRSRARREPWQGRAVFVMKRTLLLNLLVLALCAGCTQQSAHAPAPPVEGNLKPDFSAEFDRLFLSQEPFRYQDNVRFLSSIQNASFGLPDKELVRAKLRQFLSNQIEERPYAPDSDHTGVASEMAFLRLQSVQILADIGTAEDAVFIRGLTTESREEHPLFRKECQEAMEKLKEK
ncbi:MAG: hypothetical protein JSW27_10515 [Phycisphaerales bacterium]|nr:MAG: hypothetical protein JSW27_10515 [Phycisphaerales bacterium]